MDYALFLPPDDTLLLGYVESNYDTDQVRSVIHDAQQIYILPLIGTGLYNELSDQITAGTLTTLNTTLREKIKEALRMYVLADGQLVFTYKIRNKGVMTMSSDNAQPASIEALDRMIRLFKDRAQIYSDRVTRYLCANSTSYPLFDNPGSTIDTIVPNGNSFFTGWNMSLPGEDYRCSLDNPSQ